MEFARALLRWQRTHGRNDLPWQGTRDPYRVWLSEIMLQQTRVATVLSYYPRFLDRFPDVETLAGAPVESVLQSWAGLGYYARARLAHACAKAVATEYGGAFPRSAAELAQLPGIGRSTAAAIAAFCFNERAAILDANVRRVLARRYAIDGDPAQRAVADSLWAVAGSLLPGRRDMPRYTQAIMDLGAGICTPRKPQCDLCPVQDGCRAYRMERVEDFPTRRKAAPRPVRSAHFLVALRGPHVLVEQRSADGIWGGLLSLPEHPEVRALRRHARSLGALASPTPLAPRRHAFTHFTLAFTPHVVRLDPQPPRAPADGALRWLALGEIERAALPAPVLALLREVRGDAADAGSGSAGAR
ncbi:A/G-specific adenine glycosylase [Burkholderiales bacterium GJ-E10]|nr:A/G-specific adenine glycosylase [Burkholderiales bacterium GJ-E10]